MSTSAQTLWDTKAIRRAMLVLGAHPSRVNQPLELAHALRLVRDILLRRGVTAAEVFQLPGTMPLVIAGNGPVLLLTYLDDSHPTAQAHDGSPPQISGDDVTGPGVTRKAGVLAALGTILENMGLLDDVTLVVEADRHQGSIALDAWLNSSKRRFSAALYEVSDLPVQVPALFRAATGLVTLQITVRNEDIPVENVYGSVLPDTAHQIADALASLKSRDAEVLVPGFYDAVETPDTTELGMIHSIAPHLGAWLGGSSTCASDLHRWDHLTLGVFCAPAITVREIHVQSASPFLADAAQAVVDIRLMPGQNTRSVIQAVSSFLLARLPAASIEPLLIRPPARGRGVEKVSFAAHAPEIPVAPGNSPAGLLEAAGIPTVGFATTSREPSTAGERVSVERIASGSKLLQDLVRAIQTTVPRVNTSRL